MCGRYVLAANLSDIAAYFGGEATHADLWTWEPNWNMAPGIVAPVVALNGQGARTIIPMRWGLHPHWRKDMPTGKPMFNARSETAFEKPSFRTPWRSRRALIPMHGWYEWQGTTSPSAKPASGKTPYYIQPQEQGLSAFVGLWDQWRAGEGVTLLSFTILTTPALGPLKHLHHRMPVRLPEDQWHNWLDSDVKPERTITHKLGSDDIEFHEVSKTVNSGRSQGANLIIKTVD